MLKGKNTLYLMVPLNIFIWGYVGFKFYSAFSENENETAIKDPASVQVKNADTSVYTLALNYEDPFLKSESAPVIKRENHVSVHPKPDNNIVKKEPEKLPEIKYLGIISNKTSGITTALISLNNKHFIVKSGETVEGILIKSISSENLKIKIGNTTSSISKS